MSDQQELSDRLKRRPQPMFWLAIAGVLIALIVIVLIFDARSDDGTGDGNGATVLTQADSGSILTLAPEDRLTIALQSNPTTGYEWAIAEIDEQSLIYLSGSYEPEDDGLVGQGGT